MRGRRSRSLFKCAVVTALTLPLVCSGPASSAATSFTAPQLHTVAQPGAQVSKVVAAAVFTDDPVKLGHFGCRYNVVAGRAPGVKLGCPDVGDWWYTEPAPRTISFSVVVGAIKNVVGDLKFEEWSPYNSEKPLYVHNYGQTEVSLTGKFLPIDVTALRNKPGDYWAGVYFEGALAGWTPVNVLPPSAMNPASPTPYISAAVFPARSCSTQPATAPNPHWTALSCTFDDEYTTSPHPQKIAFGVDVNTSASVTGHLEVKEWSPWSAGPLWTYDFGQVNIAFIGRFITLSGQPTFRLPGDYWLDVYWNGSIIGWMPVQLVD